MTRLTVPRRAQRQPVVLPATYRTGSGMRDNGHISDLSPQGCRVVVNGLLLAVGARVVVRPQGMEGLTGVVRWADGNEVGIEFDSALYRPVFDHLSALHAVAVAPC